MQAREGHGGGAAPAEWTLLALLFAAPFEPRFGLSIGPLRFTPIEILAGAFLLAAAPRAWAERTRIFASVPWPLCGLALYALAHVVASWAAPVDAVVSLKFAARMVAMAALGFCVASLPLSVARRGFAALAVSGALVCGLALVEVWRVPGVDAFLGLFREMPFNVGGARRATAGSEYPNLAAAMMVYAGLAAIGFAVGTSRPAKRSILLAVPLGLGCLATYSRGALGAAAVALVVLAMALWSGHRRASLGGLAACGVLVLLAAGFAARGEVYRLRLAGEGAHDWYGARYELDDSAMSLRPDERRTVGVRVTNTGRKTWTDAEAFHLSYHWFDRDRRVVRDGARTALHKDVKPGESALLSAAVVAPSHEGRYLLVWDMVHEHATWFSGQGVRPAVVAVRVSTALAPPEPPTTETFLEAVAWRPQRMELWGIASSMWRDRPLLGHGSDSFRRLYGARSGRAYSDDRVYANNTLLEAAATTGAAGALALAGTLASTAFFAWRNVRTSFQDQTSERGLAAALFGMATAITVHGVVDYVLAFTGHYVVFAAVVGAVTSPEWRRTVPFRPAS